MSPTLVVRAELELLLLLHETGTITRGAALHGAALVLREVGDRPGDEWRQRLENGAYSIRAGGLYQLDKDYFLRQGGPATPGYRDWRGSLETTGQFALNEKWLWGWDGILPTDPTYFQDYALSTYQRNVDPLRTGLTEGISQLYITGKGDRSFFDSLPDAPADDAARGKVIEQMMARQIALLRRLGPAT